MGRCWAGRVCDQMDSVPHVPKERYGGPLHTEQRISASAIYRPQLVSPTFNDLEVRVHSQIMCRRSNKLGSLLFRYWLVEYFDGSVVGVENDVAPDICWHSLELFEDATQHVANWERSLLVFPNDCVQLAHLLGVSFGLPVRIWKAAAFRSACSLMDIRCFQDYVIDPSKHADNVILYPKRLGPPPWLPLLQWVWTGRLDPSQHAACKKLCSSKYT